MDDNTRLLYVWNGHEDRLQRLEDDRVSTMAQIAEQTVTLKSLKEDVGEKLQGLSDSVVNMNSSLASGIDRLETKLFQDDKRISIIENEEKNKATRQQWVRKIMYALVVASAGAISTMVIDYFKKH